MRISDWSSDVCSSDLTFNVGSKIPISSVSFDPGVGGSGTYNNVQYMETGTILNVRPRVTKDGMVFLDIVQEVSTPPPESIADENGHVRNDPRQPTNQTAARSGSQVMSARLTQDGVGRRSR